MLAIKFTTCARFHLSVGHSNTDHRKVIAIYSPAQQKIDPKTYRFQFILSPHCRAEGSNMEFFWDVKLGNLGSKLILNIHQICKSFLSLLSERGLIGSQHCELNQIRSWFQILPPCDFDHITQVFNVFALWLKAKHSNLSLHRNFVKIDYYFCHVQPLQAKSISSF